MRAALRPQKYYSDISFWLPFIKLIFRFLSINMDKLIQTHILIKLEKFQLKTRQIANLSYFFKALKTCSTVNTMNPHTR
ncbi:hypothetical protein BpHYR1_004006 [Brachionus plicatilis]|uniref:Uncharacterized protein n=1 Tax=Brachionus plicatilis TaxID=10195 RepID=A0A3M7T0R5_BRAPC|nr:hypothetical protein BpHYR1_004006 [Brachionus plicatilis]